MGLVAHRPYSWQVGVFRDSDFFYTYTMFPIEMDLLNYRDRKQAKLYIIAWISENGDETARNKFKDELRDFRIKSLMGDSIIIDDHIKHLPVVQEFLSKISEEVLYRLTQEKDKYLNTLPKLDDNDFFKLLD